MSTVVLQDSKVLLSSWEVAAFVAQGDQEAEDLRRAVVARALLSVAMDQRKRSGEENALASALIHARGEVSYFQGRVEASETLEEHGSSRQLGNQYEAAAVDDRGSRKTPALSKGVGVS